ncbi:MFS general substrate transporter [Testicularia cyperi]|uniref:MFS general substrate transporter n=1 Tax=Testicularia cyperi TaxID=1882483 RepID=A0A317XL55_9BASI|nr:MFS general substrate transporter [Testicularia cyperi]
MPPPTVDERTPLNGAPSVNGSAANANRTSYGTDSSSQDASPTPTLNEVEPPRPHGLKLAVIIGSLWVVLFMAALDGTIVVTLINSISSSFKASEKSGWLSTSYLLSVCAFSSIYGRLSDIIGRKGALLVALSFFTAGTCLCALAATMDQLLVGRFVAGIGGGGILSSSSIIMSDVIPLRDRGLWQGITNILFGTASAMGGPLGGFINDSYGWRVAFGSQVPFLVIGGACIATFVNIPLPSTGQPLRKKLARIDYLGSIMLISLSSCLLVAMNFLSGEGLPFSDVRVWGLLLGFAVFVGLFVLVEGKVVKEPIMPLWLLTRRTPGLVSASYFLGAGAHMAVIFHFPLWFQSVRLLSASKAGVHLIPISFSAAAGSLWAGLYMKRTGKYWRANIICCLLNIVSTGYGATWNENTSVLAEYVTFMPQAFGTSAIFTFMLLAMISSVRREDMATATGNVYLFRSLGSVVGVGLASAIFQMILSSSLARNITPDLLPNPSDGWKGVHKLISDIRHDASLVPTLHPEPLRHAAQKAYMLGIKSIFALITAVNVLYFLVCWPVQEVELTNSNDPKPTSPQQPQTQDSEPDSQSSTADA